MAQRASAAHAIARALRLVLLLAALAAVAAWAWQQPFMLTTRTTWQLTRLPPANAIAVPVQGVRASRIADTFGAPRGRDRTHAGVDIFAKRGTPVTSSTRGVVASVRDSGLGGRQVWIYGPGGERYYYAHLDDWAPGLQRGDVVDPGTPLGIVGDTGNARGTPPHLHFGIYGRDGAHDPLPLMRADATNGASR